jgi:DNA-binding transcriptional LysR family regulator
LTGTFLLPDIIAEFKHLHPGVRISLELGTAKQAAEWVRSHRAELGFIANAVGGPEIETEALLDSEVIVVALPALVPKRPARESLEGLTWISREEGSATRGASERAMARLGIVPRRRLELPSYEAVLSAVKSGYGVASIPRYVVAAELRAGSLIVIPVRGWKVRAVVSVLRVRDALLTPSAVQFQTLVRERFAEKAAQRPSKSSSRSFNLKAHPGP